MGFRAASIIGNNTRGLARPGLKECYLAHLSLFASAASKSYKEQKEDARKARAGDIAGWNASFVRADTVVDALADRLGVGKGDILDREEVSFVCYGRLTMDCAWFHPTCFLREREIAGACEKNVFFGSFALINMNAVLQHVPA